MEGNVAAKLASDIMPGMCEMKQYHKLTAMCVLQSEGNSGGTPLNQSYMDAKVLKRNCGLAFSWRIQES